MTIRRFQVSNLIRKYFDRVFLILVQNIKHRITVYKEIKNCT